MTLQNIFCLASSIYDSFTVGNWNIAFGKFEINIMVFK